jgi:SAM-dependent methyltransferase
MLQQACAALQGLPSVHLEQIVVRAQERAGLPYAPQTFDLIICTNALHDFADPVTVLAGLRQLLVPGGQFILEDYAERPLPFPWFLVEWLARQLEEGHVRAYTLMEVQSLCRQAGLVIHHTHSFVVDWLWQGWVLALSWPERPDDPHGS